MKALIKESIAAGMSYDDYRSLVSNLLIDHKSTGSDQSEALTNYSLLNDRRMKRLDKTLTLSDVTTNALHNLTTPQTWLVLTEGWCGDAAQNIPVLNKLAEESQVIDLKLVLRDEHTGLMDQFLTKGSRSIPKLISVDDNYNILFTWGPRPSEAAKMIATYKEQHGIIDAPIKEALQIWYNKNKGENLAEDLLRLLDITKKVASV